MRWKKLILVNGDLLSTIVIVSICEINIFLSGWDASKGKL